MGANGGPGEDGKGECGCAPRRRLMRVTVTLQVSATRGGTLAPTSAIATRRWASSAGKKLRGTPRTRER